MKVPIIQPEDCVGLEALALFFLDCVGVSVFLRCARNHLRVRSRPERATETAHLTCA